MENVQLLRDFEYARVGDKTLLLDLYLPQTVPGDRLDPRRRLADR